jgi:hypothetical protein
MFYALLLPLLLLFYCFAPDASAVPLPKHDFRDVAEALAQEGYYTEPFWWREDDGGDVSTLTATSNGQLDVVLELRR